MVANDDKGDHERSDRDRKPSQLVRREAGSETADHPEPKARERHRDSIQQRVCCRCEDADREVATDGEDGEDRHGAEKLAGERRSVREVDERAGTEGDDDSEDHEAQLCISRLHSFLRDVGDREGLGFGFGAATCFFGTWAAILRAASSESARTPLLSFGR